MMCEIIYVMLIINGEKKMQDNKKVFKLGSWNVNGLRACMTKGFMDFFNKEDFDVLGLQEIKMNKEQRLFELRGSGRRSQRDFDFGNYERKFQTPKVGSAPLLSGFRAF